MLYKKVLIVFSIFFISMLIVMTLFTLFLYNSSKPEVEIVVAQSIDNLWIVPASSIHTGLDNRKYVMLVVQEEGAWGIEFVCYKSYINIDSYTEADAIVHSLRELNYPIVAIANERIIDGDAVKIAQ